MGSFAQPYTNWIVGNPADAQTNHQSGTVLAGGGGDNDDAMTWMLQRADGGDVVVIRSSGSNGYNDYFFSDLGVNVHSVETILIPSQAAANDPYVAQQIENAEVLFIAGGDQYEYWQYWHGTPVQDAINYLINEKGATVGGTSAGMAIMGHLYYAPENLGVTSQEAMRNPYHENMSFIGQDDFIQNPILQNTLTDTHFEQRDREGRSFAFLARTVVDWDIRTFLIACNEYTAVCVDENGIGQVFGDYPAYDDFAYFMQVNCFPNNTPEQCEPGEKLIWKGNREVVKVYKVPGTSNGSNNFDLNTWTSGNGGSWEDWFSNKRGGLKRALGAEAPTCSSTVLAEELQEYEALANQKTPSGKGNFTLFPNPARDVLYLRSDTPETVNVSVVDAVGKVWHRQQFTASADLNLQLLPANRMYFLVVQDGQSTEVYRFVKL